MDLHQAALLWRSPDSDSTAIYWEHLRASAEAISWGSQLSFDVSIIVTI